MEETNYYASNRSMMRSDWIWKNVKSVGERVRKSTGLAWRTAVKVGKEDPRRVVHSLKVGFALTLVSLLYLIKPLFEGIGQNAMSAVLTVVVVMEFTVGNTYLPTSILSHSHYRVFFYMLFVQKILSFN